MPGPGGAAADGAAAGAEGVPVGDDGDVDDEVEDVLFSLVVLAYFMFFGCKTTTM